MNFGFLILRSVLEVAILTLIVLSQVFWYRALWRWSANWGSRVLRIGARMLCLLLVALSGIALVENLFLSRRHLIPNGSIAPIVLGLWFACAFFGYIAIKFVNGFDRIWSWAKRLLRPAPVAAEAVPESVADPSRRYFFKTATAVAGAAPFLTAIYGFSAERLNYQTRRVELPIANLPQALDGMTIVQLSDIHMSGYMPRAQVRRAVDMANDLGADLAVVTGDFITGANDPLAECIEEIRRLSAPLGVWGCNGNHEIYAKAENAAERYFKQMGMKLLRQENVQLTYRGAQFNLIGVDYQRERATNGRKMQNLQNAEHLVRRDMPNILLSHNPNSFNRAAELGIELSLAGHTHGGQVQVEILDHRLSPARFITDYIAGHYARPLYLPAKTVASQKFLAAEALQQPFASLYVNRGLGTVGAPVRLGVPPEISLLTLRRA